MRGQHRFEHNVAGDFFERNTHMLIDFVEILNYTLMKRRPSMFQRMDNVRIKLRLKGWPTVAEEMFRNKFIIE